MAITNNRSLARPAKDEWGVYDPQQAGLAALFQRLDTNNDKHETTPASRLSMSAAAAPAKPAAIPTRPPLRESK